MDAGLNPEKLLVSNLNLISCIKPIPNNVKDAVKESMVFSAQLFSELLYILLCIIDPEKCNAVLVWPCLHRKDEYKFKTGVCKIINEMCAIESNDILQPLKPHLIAAPINPQATQFMWILSTYALRHLTITNLPDIDVPNYRSISRNPVINKARTNCINGIIASNSENTGVLLLAHKKRVYHSVEESRKLRLELFSIENDIREAEEELQMLWQSHENYLGDSKSLRDINKIDKSIEKWSIKIRDERNDLAANVQILVNFEKIINTDYEIMVDIMDKERRVKLDGKVFKVSIPPAISNQVVLYQGDNLILENLFKVGFEIIKTLHGELAGIDFSDLLNYSPVVSGFKADISLLQIEFLNIFAHLSQFQSGIQQSISNNSYSRISASCLNSPLTLRAIQSPLVVFKNSSVCLHKISLPKGDEERLLLKLTKNRNEKNNVADENEVFKIQPPLVSRLKQPKKIGLLGSNKGSENVQFKELKLANKNVLPDKNAYSVKKINKENVTPKKCVNKLAYKSSTTPGRNERGLSINKASAITPHNRQSIYGLNNQPATITGNVQRSTSAMSLLTSPSLFADEESMEANDFNVRELDNSEFLNLSKETVPSDHDCSHVSISTVTDSEPTTSCTLPKKEETVGSPSAVIKNPSKRTKYRPSVEKLLERYNNIRKRQKESGFKKIHDHKPDQ